MKLRQMLKSKKGFTLMEIIVVLIIVAVLAAALIPSFVGFIRDSRAATYINEAGMGMTAAQILVTEAHGASAADGTQTSPFTAANSGNLTTLSQARFTTLLQGDAVPTGFTQFTMNDPVAPATLGQRVTGLYYTNGQWQVWIDPAGTARHNSGNGTRVAGAPAA